MDGEHMAVSDTRFKPPDLSLAIPFYNEEPNVNPVLMDLTSTLESAGIDFEILAVNNGSTDATEEMIQAVAKEDPRIRLVKVEKNRGYGFGILQGLKEGIGEVLGYIWGDGQVAAQDLLRIYQALEEEGADLAKARRVERHDGWYRLIQTRCYAICFFLFFGRGFTDPNGCPKLFRRKAYEEISPRSHDWLLDPEIMVKAKRSGLKVVHVPVVFMKRKRGRSKVSVLTAFGFFFGLVKMRFRAHS